MAVLLAVLIVLPIPDPDPTGAEVDLLARLLAAEVGGVDGQAQIDMALSILDTVYWRTEHRVLSDGTVAGTVGWHSESGIFQFPPCLLWGPDWSENDTCRSDADLDRYRLIVWAYEAGLRGSCREYSHYHSLPDKPGQCWIRSDNGMFMTFYDGRWNAPEPTGWDARLVPER